MYGSSTQNYKTVCIKWPLPFPITAHGTILINFGSDKRFYIFEFPGSPPPQALPWTCREPMRSPDPSLRSVPPPQRKILDPHLISIHAFKSAIEYWLHILKSEDTLLYKAYETNRSLPDSFATRIKILFRRVAPYTPTRSCVHIGVLKKKK